MITSMSCILLTPPPPPNARRQEENAVWDQVQAKDACLRRLGDRGFPQDMLTLAEASDRFYELGVYYRNPLEVRYHMFHAQRLLALRNNIRTVEVRGTASSRRNVWTRRCLFTLHGLYFSHLSSVQYGPLIVRKIRVKKSARDLENKKEWGLRDDYHTKSYILDGDDHCPRN